METTVTEIDCPCLSDIIGEKIPWIIKDLGQDHCSATKGTEIAQKS